MENRAWAIESGWTWTEGTTSSKDTWTKIWGDGAGAVVKDGAAVVKTISLNISMSLFHWKIFKSVFSVVFI